ncbi:hypothetical protein HOY82DRAFT_80864 [Tuber indicum]|nr:hypothetical protein HOY82DRAFT_80864 [Tuber indicum]
MLLLRLRRLLRLFGMSLLGGFHGVLFYCYNCSVSFGFNCQSLCSVHQDEEIVTLLFLYFFPLFLCFFPSQARANLTALGNANFPSRFSACHLFGVSRVGMVMGWVCVSSCQ